MMPSIELRLATMQRALCEVILPAIATDNPLAREQAQLLVAHLDLLGLQMTDASAFDALILRGTVALAEQLATRAAGGERTQTAAFALRAALRDTVGTPTAHRAALAAAIDGLVDAMPKDGTHDFRVFAHDAIVEHAARYGTYERAWFAATGLDPERASLPSIADIFSAE